MQSVFLLYLGDTMDITQFKTHKQARMWSETHPSFQTVDLVDFVGGKDAVVDHDFV